MKSLLKSLSLFTAALGLLFATSSLQAGITAVVDPVTRTISFQGSSTRVTQPSSYDFRWGALGPQAHNVTPLQNPLQVIGHPIDNLWTNLLPVMIEWNIEGVPTQVIGEDVDHRTEPSTTPITSFPEFLISYASVPVADQFEELLDQGRFVLQPIWGATEPLVFVLKEPRQWNTWDGGGGYGIGARFAVYGTLGQPDAGRMSGSRFALNGGFWNRAVAVQQPGLPVLSITRGTGNFIIHWDPESPGFILQVSDSLTSPNWIDVSGNPTSPATVPDDGVLKFYRLRKP